MSLIWTRVTFPLFRSPRLTPSQSQEITGEVRSLVMAEVPVGRSVIRVVVVT